MWGGGQGQRQGDQAGGHGNSQITGDRGCDQTVAGAMQVGRTGQTVGVILRKNQIVFSKYWK